MAKRRKNIKTKNKENQEKYNAENEIIIGVTTINKEKRVDEKKSTRTNHASRNRSRTSNNKKVNRKDKIIKNKMELSKDETIKKGNKRKIIISFIISLIILVACLIFLMTTPKFYITNIEIEGNKKNSEETYLSLTKIELNTTNIFSISKKSITKNLKENSYVENVEIKRKLPGTLQITIKEREIAYQAKYNDKYIYLDKQGYILEISEESKKTTKLIGLDSTNEGVYEGQRLKNNDLLKLDTVLKIVNQCKYNSIENTITNIDLSDESDIILNIDNGQKIVYLGDATSLSERILWLKTILQKEKKNKGEIFINGDLNDGKVYFKPVSK